MSRPSATVALHPDYGISSDAHLFWGAQNRPYVSAHWIDPLHRIRVFANVPADEVTVCVALKSFE